MKPILFSTPMVQAILAGRKSQTRRVVKPQNIFSCNDGYYFDVTDQIVRCESCQGWVSQMHKEVPYMPPYLTGDILWVRETWFVDECKPDCAGRTDDNECPFNRVNDKCYGYKTQYNGTPRLKIKWRPSIFMPREAARIFLRVTDVRAERVQDITEADALAEGVEKLFDHMPKVEYEDWAKRTGEKLTQEEQSYKNYLWHGHFGRYGTGNKQSDAWEHQYSNYNSARDSYSSLWHKLNAKSGFGWETNPWVWVISFERVNISEDRE